MITGAHTILFSNDAEADRAFFRDVLGLSNIDLGGGWLVFKSPPAEIAFHPATESGASEFYFMCDDIEAFIARMKEKDAPCDPVRKENWGLLTCVTLPSGGKLPVYQPLHERP